MSSITDDRLANVDIGGMIRCCDCNVNKMVGRYSNNQLNKYRMAILGARRGGKPAALPKCIACTAGSVEELKCTWCGQVKAISEFSGRHRSNPDDAKCANCQQEIEDREPDLQAAIQEEEILEDYRSRSQPAYSNMSSMASALPSISGPVSEAGTAPISQDGVYLASENRFGPQSAPPARTPSETDSTASTWNVQTSSLGYSTRSADSNPARGSRDAFAKQGAYRPSVTERVINRADRDHRQQQRMQAMQSTKSSVAHHEGGQESDDEDWEL